MTVGFEGTVGRIRPVSEISATPQLNPRVFTYEPKSYALTTRPSHQSSDHKQLEQNLLQ